MNHQCGDNDFADADPCRVLFGRDLPTSASELMYFAGAPLAHVVDFEEQQRARRMERAFRNRNIRPMLFG